MGSRYIIQVLENMEIIGDETISFNGNIAVKIILQLCLSIGYLH